MSTFPNILPTAGTDSLNSGESMTYPGTPDRTGEPFNHLMMRALSPISNKAVPPVEQSQPVKNKTDYSELRTKNGLPRAPTSGKISEKTPNRNSSAGPKLSTSPEANLAVVNLENISIQTVAPVVAADPKCLLPLNGTAAVKSVAILPAASEAKNPPRSAATVSSQAIPQSQARVEPNSVVKTDSHAKITTAVEALAAEKIDSADSKITVPTAVNPQIPPLAKEASDSLTTPKPAQNMFTQSPQDEFSKLPDLTAKTAAQDQPDVNGTSAAQQDVPMKNTENTDKAASSAGKYLPGPAASVARGNNLPPLENSSSLTLSRAGQMAATVAANSAPSDQSTNVVLSSGDSIVSTASADFRARALERTQDMVVMHSKSMSDSGNNLLQVVIKPGAGMQLSLELRQRGDAVEAQAVLQRGDFKHLNQQWPALQQQLEQRGIRLAPLASDGNLGYSDGSHSFQNQQNQSAEPDSFPAAAFAEATPAGSFAQPAARAGAHRGWETWA
jgi:hypothetical protein